MDGPAVRKVADAEDGAASLSAEGTSDGSVSGTPEETDAEEEEAAGMRMSTHGAEAEERRTTIRLTNEGRDAQGLQASVSVCETARAGGHTPHACASMWRVLSSARSKIAAASGVALASYALNNVPASSDKQPAKGASLGVDFVLLQEAWSNQEEDNAQAYHAAHCGTVDANHRSELARSFGFERIRGAPLFDDPRSKESEIYFRSSVWTPIGKPVAVPTDLEADGVQYTVYPDKARGAVAQLFQRKSDASDRLVVVSLWMPHVKYAATHAPFQQILTRIVKAVEAAVEPTAGRGVEALPFVFAGDWNELGYTGRLKNEAEATGYFSVGDRRFYNLMFQKDADGKLRNRDGCARGTLQQSDRMMEGCAEVQGGQVIRGKRMARFPFAVSPVPTDNVLFSCCGAHDDLTSTVRCDYDQFASDHLPVEATVTRSQGTIKVVSWNIGQTDLTYFYGAQPEHVYRVKGTLIKFAANELAPASLELPMTESRDVIDKRAKSEDSRVVATKGTRWVTVGWPANVNAGLAKIFAGGGDGDFA